MDSMQKRVRFIEDAAERFELRNVVPLCGRAEDIGQDGQHREAYDVCVARAVAELPTLAELCLPLVRQGGIWMPAKGASIEVCSAADRLTQRCLDFTLFLTLFLTFRGPSAASCLLFLCVSVLCTPKDM
jgi:16S rRNA G527 N7-methylase RsmG